MTTATECTCGNPISESTAHVPCVDCGSHIMVAVDEQTKRWRCGRCGETPVAVEVTTVAFERWRLIQDLANEEPYDADDDCHHCEHVRGRPHADDCLHLRANRLVDQTGDRP
jgi:ribosomal protein S27AE